MRWLVAGVLALATSACSASVYKTEVEKMASAGRVLAAAPDAYFLARREVDISSQRSIAVFDVLDGAELEEGPDCSSGMDALAASYPALGDDAARDAVFEQLSRQEVCLFGAAEAPARPTDLEAALSRELKTYLSALEAIVSGDTITELEQALTEARAAGRGLAKAAERPEAAAVSDLAFTLLAFDLEQRRYAALQNAVNAFDPAWNAAEPAITRALRLRHVNLVTSRADQASDTRRRMVLLLNRPEWRGAPAERLEMFNQLDSQLAAENTALRAALDGDPAATVSAFTKAHGKLREALNDRSRQTEGLLAAVADLTRDAAALDAALEEDAE